MNIIQTITLLLAVAAGAAHAAEPAEVETYLQELARVEAAPAPHSLEPLFQRASEAQDALMKIDGNFADGDLAYVETLDDAAYAALRNRLTGFAMSRDGAIYAQPDPAFLFELAQTRGRPADQEFFRLHRAFWGEKLFPVYMVSRGDVSGCVRYGEGIVIELYEDWRRYAKAYPDAYKPAVQQTIKDLEDTVSLGTCACGDAASVVKELQGFVRRFPDSPARADARSRMQEIRSGSIRLPIGCR